MAWWRGSAASAATSSTAHSTSASIPKAPMVESRIPHLTEDDVWQAPRLAAAMDEGAGPTEPMWRHRWR